MRILGGKDYYDSALAYGYDPNIVFLRGRFTDAEPSVRPHEYWVKNTVVDSYGYQKPDILVEPIPGREGLARQSYLHKGIKGPAGNVEYPCFAYVYVWLAGTRYGGITLQVDDHEELTQYFWTMESFTNYLAKHCYQIKNDEVNTGTYQSKRMISRYESIQEQFDRSVVDQAKMVERGHSIVILMPKIGPGRYNNVKYVCSIDTEGLDKVQFQKRMSAFEVMQELSMWVGGVLPKPGNQMVKITDDKVKIVKAGFDVKTSFRHPVKIPRRKDKK